MKTGSVLAMTRWSKSPRVCSSIQCHSSSSTMSRFPGVSTRAARESTTTSRERPKSRWNAKRADVVVRSAAAAKRRSRGPASASSWTSANRRSSASSGGARLPRCWYSQYAMKAPTMRSCHHDVRRIFSTQAEELFQSSETSWSSQIIVLGTVESSQRTSGSLHASR